MNWHALRIAIVGPLPPPAGGMAGQTQQLAELLRGEGAEVHVIQTNPPYTPRWIAGLRGVRALPRLVQYVIRLWKAAGKVQVFHVMANSGWSWHLVAVPAIWIGYWRGIPVVVNYRGGDAHRFLQRSARLVRPSLNAASAVVVPSGFLEHVFGAVGIGTLVVPNVVDLSRFRPVNPEARTKRASLDVLVPRNLERIYDNETGLRAFALALNDVPNCRLVIAGSGPEEANLRALVEQLGIAGHVEFAGRMNRDQMASRYDEAALVLNPSRVDNTPNSVLEALASGVPIVSTDVGGIPYLLCNEDTALLVPSGDARRMATAMVRVLKDPFLAERLAAAGLKDVQRYSWSHVRDTLGTVYVSVLGPTASSGRLV